MAATLAPLGPSLSLSGLSGSGSMSISGGGSAERTRSRRSSSSSGPDELGKNRISTASATPPSDENRLSSLTSVRSSQFSDSTYDPTDSRIMQASMGHLRGQSTPAVVFALPRSQSERTLPPIPPKRRSSLAQGLAGPPAGLTVTTTNLESKGTDRRTSLPPSPYFRPSTVQPVASTSTSTPSSPIKRLPRSSSSRRSINSMLGSIFHGPVPGMSALSPPATPKQPDGFSSDSWQHAVAVQVIEAGQIRPDAKADLAAVREDKVLPSASIREEEEAQEPTRESWHDPAAAYFGTTEDEDEQQGAASRHSRKPSQTSEWSLDVDLGGQGLGIAYLFEDDDLKPDFMFPADTTTTNLPPPLTSNSIAGHERGRTHSSTPSTSTAFSSVPPVTPRMRASSPHAHFGGSTPRPSKTTTTGRFSGPGFNSKDAPDDESSFSPPHLPDLPPCSPLLAGILPALADPPPIATLPSDALLDLSPRRRSLRPPGIARTRAPVVEDEEDDEELILFSEGLLSKGAEDGGAGAFMFARAAEEGGILHARLARGRRSSLDTFGQRRSLVATEIELDLASEGEEDGWASEAETRSSVYSQRSATMPLVIPNKSSVPVEKDLGTSTTGSTTPTQLACSPVQSLRRAKNIVRDGSHSRSSSSTSVASMGTEGGRGSPSRPMKNPARLAVELQKEGEGGGLW